MHSRVIIEKISWWGKFKRIIKDFTPKRFSLQERVVLFKQLSTLVLAGIPIQRSLSAIIKSHNNEHVKGMLEDIFISVSKGISLSKSLNYYPNLFDAHTIALIEAGELQGELGLALKQLSESYEAKLELLHSIGDALFYPVFVLISSIVITISLTYFALPSIEGTLYALNVPLPPLTSATINFLSFFKSPFSIITVVVVMIGLIILSKNYFAILDNRKIIEHLLYKLPFCKSLLHTINGIRFCQIYCDLYKSGLPLMTSLSHIAMTMESLLAQDEIKKIIVLVTRGELLSEAFRRGKMFPELVGSMLSIAEKTGQLELLLTKTYSYLTIDIKYSLEKFRQSIGPMLILLLGVVITFFILIFFLPIYSGMNAITL